jgi:hypothetical protein
MKDVKSLSDQEFYSSRHLRSIFRASHSLASFTLPSLPLVSSLGNMGNKSGPRRLHDKGQQKQPERKNIRKAGGNSIPLFLIHLPLSSH